MKTNTTEREKRQWFAVSNGDVRKVTGYSCAPRNPDMWWCPDVGFSGSEGHHLFATRAEAIDQAIKETERDLAEAQERLARLKRKRGNP